LTLALQWNFLRTPRENFYSLSERPGFLRLHLRPQHLAERSNPSFVGRRQQHINFKARTMMAFAPEKSNECAGLVLLQNDDFHFRFVVTLNGEGALVVRLVKREGGEESVLAEQGIGGSEFYLKVAAVGQDYSFSIATEAGQWQLVAGEVDGRILSTPMAGGFIGAYIGMYASSNGSPSQNQADFDWFEYTEAVGSGQ
jgi:alpha-N-arabinofuranosidase